MKGYTDPAEAWGKCLITASAYSEKNGCGLVCVTGLTYPRREHWASVTFTQDDLSDATVIDLTMRQFDAERPALWEGSLDDWLDDMTECLVDNLAYSIYSGNEREEPIVTDTWVREDIEPGQMLQPWRTT